MDPKRFLSHEIRVHLQRTRLTDCFDAKQHWVFAMTAECGSIVLALNQLHEERCGATIPTMIVACGVPNYPAFFLFPKENLAFYEISTWLDITVADSQEQAAQMSYFTLAMQDPKPLGDALAGWLYRDHLTS
jgi:hypothetical protein